MSAVLEPLLIERLERIVGPAGLVRAPADQKTYLTDWGGKWHGRTLVVVRPADTQAMADVVRLCCETHTPIVPQGGHTGDERWRHAPTTAARRSWCRRRG